MQIGGGHKVMTFNPSLDRSHPKHAVVCYFEYLSSISKPQSCSENFYDVDEVHISGIVCLLLPSSAVS